MGGSGGYVFQINLEVGGGEDKVGHEDVLGRFRVFIKGHDHEGMGNLVSERVQAVATVIEQLPIGSWRLIKFGISRSECVIEHF